MIAGAVIVAAGVAVPLVEVYRVRWGLPRLTVWAVVACTVAVVTAIRAASRRR